MSSTLFTPCHPDKVLQRVPPFSTSFQRSFRMSAAVFYFPHLPVFPLASRWVLCLNSGPSHLLSFPIDQYVYWSFLVVGDVSGLVRSLKLLALLTRPDCPLKLERGRTCEFMNAWTMGRKVKLFGRRRGKRLSHLGLVTNRITFH